MTTAEPILRTLSPALRLLEKGLRGWLEAAHRFPIPTLTRAALHGLADDLGRKADTLDMDKPLLTVMLMGGTGVGKSTLLNALAGGNIAQASFARPTTRDPVVYFHESVQASRLDPALRHCRLAQHDRPALEQKIVVDTPDLDSNDLENREKLHRLLPVADVVLYVGSQEKYHDRLGWDLFLHERKRRAFAFVLNKWDRCVQPGADGVRPDEDLLRDLKAEGFENPLIFRTCAQYWVDFAATPHPNPPPQGGREKKNGPQPPVSAAPLPAAPLPPARSPSTVALPAPSPLAGEGWGGGRIAAPADGEQFQDLSHWLENGLTRLEIESIKARGVGQLLAHLRDALTATCPPDLTLMAGATRDSWQRQLHDEAHATAQVLLDTLEPFQREVEHHFAAERQRHFRGVMGGYLQLFNKLKYAGSQLRVRIPFLPRLGQPAERQTRLDLGEFARTCSAAASERHLDARGKALADRLLLAADQHGFPLTFLTKPTEAAAKLDWRQRNSQAMIDVLSKVQQEWARPTGIRRYLQGTLVLLADWLPSATFILALVWLLWRYFMGDSASVPHLWDMALPFLLMLSVCVILHIFVALLLPLRWQSIRDEFQRQLTTLLRGELIAAYGDIPQAVAEQLLAERRKIEQLLHDTSEVQTWLHERELAASIDSLYGK
jgi:energy-coupling factor transporter ATP-binding protein EcfA2